MRYLPGFFVFIILLAVNMTAWPARPNILLIQVDDMGYDDLSCNGNLIAQTPNIDALSQTSVRFDNFMLCNVCSPTRASLLTGRDFWRTGVSGMHGGNDFMHLDETTFAEIFQGAGYRTGMWGKWHSGKADGYWPWDRGFDEGYYAKLYNYFPSNGYFNEYPELTIHTDEWSPKVLVDYTIDFISGTSQAPFLAYCSFLTCHGIWNTPDEYRNKYMAEGRTVEFATLLGMLEFMDTEVGRLLKFLTENGLDENTLVIFISDNGPINMGESGSEWKQRNNHGFLGNKSRLWQNGLKSPLYIRWKGKYQPADIGRLVSITDIFPTLLDIAGVPLPPGNLPLDGRSIKPYLEGDTTGPGEKSAIFSQWFPVWEQEQFAPVSPETKAELDFDSQKMTLLTGNFKLLQNPASVDGSPAAYEGKVLIDLKNNPMETVNIAEDHPEIVRAMLQEMKDWFGSIKNEAHSFAPPVFQIGWKGKTSSEVLAYGPSKTVGVDNDSHQLRGFDAEGDSVEYKINVHRSGVYHISLSTTGGNMSGILLKTTCEGNELESVLTNQSTQELGLLFLDAGEHSFTLEVAEITEGSSAQIKELKSLYFDLDEDSRGLSDPDATKETAMLFRNLKKKGREGIIFGQHLACYEAQNWKDTDISTDLKSDCFKSVGDHPGVIGFDFGRGIPLFKDYSEEIFRRGGISTYSWHARNPVTGGSVNDVSGDPVASILAGGAARQVWLEQLEEVGDYFNSLEVQGIKVPVIFRPFHENTGGWFWWGAGNCTNQQFIDLWRFTVDYLRNEKGVHNILLAYSPSKPSANVLLTHEMYPGDDYVDIIGFDSYSEDEELKTLIIDGSRLVCQWARDSHKVPAMTEIGIKKGIQNSTNRDWFISGLLDQFRNDEIGREVAYVMTWMNTSPDSYWVPLPGQANYESFVNFYKDPATLFMGDMESIYGIPVQDKEKGLVQ